MKHRLPVHCLLKTTVIPERFTHRPVSSTRLCCGGLRLQPFVPRCITSKQQACEETGDGEREPKTVSSGMHQSLYATAPVADGVEDSGSFRAGCTPLTLEVAGMVISMGLRGAFPPASMSSPGRSGTFRTSSASSSQ